MLSSIALVPSTPLLVPDLASGAAAETADLREAALIAAAALPDRWVAIGVGRTDSTLGPDATGTFAGYGVDVPVSLSGRADATPSPLPLCALVVGWLRGAARPDAVAEVRVHAGDTAGAAAVAAGRRLRTELEGSDDAVGVLVVADGAHTLTPSAPGGHDPASVPVQAALDDALAAGDADVLAQENGPASIAVGRVAYQVLAGLVGPSPRAAKELYRGAPYGVGYLVGLWTP